MYIVENRKLFFVISGMLVFLSILAISVWGLNLGIDFVGGTLFEVEFDSLQPISDISNSLEKLEIGSVLVQQTGESGVIIRTKELNDDNRRDVIQSLSALGPFEEKRFTSIGPIIGRELQKKALTALILTLVLIIIFVAFAFRHVSKPVSSWKYGVIAIVALIHDILIPTGLFAVMGRFNNVEAGALFVTALLAILGLSVNDTIVVFDRVRENLNLKVAKSFDEIVGVSLKQTITRSVNTSVTTLFVLLAIFLVGPDSTRDFSLVLAVGLIAGTYSSIFLASPLLVEFSRFGRVK